MSTVARIQFVEAKVIERTIGDFKMKQQAGYLKINEHISHEIQVRVPDDGKPYEPGFYLIGAETFRTDDYGRLQISKKGIVLVREDAARPVLGK